MTVKYDRILSRRKIKSINIGDCFYIIMPLYKYVKEFFIPPGIYVTIFALGTLYLWLIHTLVKKINQKSISCGYASSWN